MASSDSVAVIALLVSLIALLVASGQLLQQVFGTADGYRRCSEAVIGVWHRKRRRHFLWSELRIETTYVTPQISLFSPQEFIGATDTYSDVYLLCPPSPWVQNSAIVKETVHPSPPSKKIAFRDLIRYRFRRPSSPENLELPWRSVAKSRRLGATKGWLRPRSDSELVVSWLRLLKELHAVYSQHWRQDCEVCNHPRGDLQCANRSDTRTWRVRGEQKEVPNAARTDATVIYRRWNWDFMPPDQVRPLAESTVGDMVVLALRMGMQWRSLQPADGKMQADGNGFSLSGANVRGLGLVLRLAAAGHHEEFPSIIPSRAADKMLCGILPGDPSLVGRDFNVIDRQGRSGLTPDKDGLLVHIGVPDSDRTAICEQSDQSLHNEVMSLLCAFLPLPNSTETRHEFLPWREKQSIHHCFESRYGLSQCLKERIETSGRGSSHASQLLLIHSKLEFLEIQQSDVFNGVWNIADQCSEAFNICANKSGLVKDCRAVFDWTNDHLRELKAKLVLQKYDLIPDQVFYLHLVSAHACMAHMAIDKLSVQANVDQIYRRKGRVSIRADIANATHRHFDVLDYYERAYQYVTEVQHPEHGIAAFLNKRNYVSVTDDEGEELWWTLMVRGIAWDMSTWKGDWRGDPVPSSFYNDKTPVWIT